MFIQKLRNWLLEPTLENVDVNDDELLTKHIEILKSKTLLRSAFNTFYEDMSSQADQHISTNATEIELGSGAGFFKDKRPNVLTSDVRKSPILDLELDAQNMPFENQSVGCIFAINVFHHLPAPEEFLHEIVRVLHANGGCILVEPHNGFLSKHLHRHLHSDEHFDINALGWNTDEINGPMAGANQAKAHIVFSRDRERFEQLFGDHLEIVSQTYCLNSFRYLFSGGLNFRQLLPSMSERPLKWIESLASPFAKFWSLHRITVIRRKN
ncbi:hypothetical protein NBRC116583_15250 [Arenicella sp. 4NH20-0111]|uniref:class I SAM-dependent methyltransferase n=1 Tax=Arenicella sp. 4NH20-0111 TaxID=3127648 RepID=UPI003106FF38